MPETHVAISFEQAHALVTRWHGEWAAEVENEVGFRPPRIHEGLAETIQIGGVVYKFVPDLMGIEFRKRGRPWFRTGLPLWDAPEPVIEGIRILMKGIISGRTVSMGFNIGIR